MVEGLGNHTHTRTHTQLTYLKQVGLLGQNRINIIELFSFFDCVRDIIWSIQNTNISFLWYQTNCLFNFYKMPIFFYTEFFKGSWSFHLVTLPLISMSTELRLSLNIFFYIIIVKRWEWQLPNLNDWQILTISNQVKQKRMFLFAQKLSFIFQIKVAFLFFNLYY